MVKTDRRVQRTREALSEALNELLLEMPYDEITVQQILDRANVGRSTFYMHFRDKDDLLMAGIEELREMLSAASEKGREAGGRSENLIRFSFAMFEHANDFRKTYHALVVEQVWGHVRQRVQNMIADLIRTECEADLARLRRAGSKLPPELFVHYLASTFMSVLTWWVDHDSGLSPKEIDRLFRALVLPTARSVIG